MILTWRKCSFVFIGLISIFEFIIMPWSRHQSLTSFNTLHVGAVVDKYYRLNIFIFSSCPGQWQTVSTSPDKLAMCPGGVLLAGWQYSNAMGGNSRVANAIHANIHDLIQNT